MGIVFGLLVAAFLIAVESTFRKVSVRGLSSMVFGLVLGVIMAKVISDILSLLPLGDVFLPIARVILTVSFSYLGAVMALRGKDELIRGIVEQGSGTLKAMISGEAFLTPPGELSETMAAVVEEVTGIAPEASTTGGTSDARFLSKLCPVVEFGLCNATMHKLDEAVAIADLDALTEIYRRVTLRLLAA